MDFKNVKLFSRISVGGNSVAAQRSQYDLFILFAVFGEGTCKDTPGNRQNNQVLFILQ